MSTLNEKGFTGGEYFLQESCLDSFRAKTLSHTHTHTQKAHHNKYMYRVVDTHANDCERTSDSSDLPNDSSLARAPFSALLLCQLKGEKVGNQSAFVCLYVCALSVLVCVCLNV